MPPEIDEQTEREIDDWTEKKHICPECDEPYDSEYHFVKSCVAPIDEDQLKYGDL